MNELGLRLERIEDALLEIAESVENGEIGNVYARVGNILFDGIE